MKCPPAVLAATFLLQVAIFYWKFICLIEDTKPNWENLASLGKTAWAKQAWARQEPLFSKAAPGEIGACPSERRIVLTRRRPPLVVPLRASNVPANVGVAQSKRENGNDAAV